MLFICALCSAFFQSDCNKAKTFEVENGKGVFGRDLVDLLKMAIRFIPNCCASQIFIDSFKIWRYFIYHLFNCFMMLFLNFFIAILFLIFYRDIPFDSFQFPKNVKLCCEYRLYQVSIIGLINGFNIL